MGIGQLQLQLVERRHLDDLIRRIFQGVGAHRVAGLNIIQRPLQVLLHIPSVGIGHHTDLLGMPVHLLDEVAAHGRIVFHGDDIAVLAPLAVMGRDKQIALRHAPGQRHQAQ